MRGMALVNAATLIAELGDFSRFANPRNYRNGNGSHGTNASGPTFHRLSPIRWAGQGLARIGWGIKQLTLAAVGFKRYAKSTRRVTFLAEMEGRDGARGSLVDAVPAD
jgi:hypothetical protein